MRLDIDRIGRYLHEIQSRYKDLTRLLGGRSDAELLADAWVLKGLKYVLVEMAEAMANTLQHILAKDYGEPVTGYVETVIRAGDQEVLPKPLAVRLRPFFDFRNSLIHRYWNISDKKLLILVRENVSDFSAFVDAIEVYLKRRSTAPSGGDQG